MAVIPNRGRTIGSRLLVLRDYLYTHASPTNAVKMKDIKEYLESRSFPAGVKVIYGDLNALKDDFGLQVEYVEKKKGYILKNPPFEPYELRLMIDSIQSSKFITQKKADEIIEKIKEMTPEQIRATLSRQVYVADRIRSMNDSVVKDADRIHEAIATDSKIGFRYFHYSPNKKEKRYSKSGERYIVSPYALYWNNGNYYLYAYDGKKFRYFRVDRMENIGRPLAEKREGKDEYSAKNITNRTAKIFNMYSGKEQRVVMRFRNELADAVFDEFGKDIVTIPDGDDHFTVNAAVEVSPPFYAWVATFGRRAKIIAPAAVVEGMKDFIGRIAEMYKDDGNV